MALSGFLIIFPIVVAAVLYFVKSDAIRGPIVYASAGIIAVASIAFAIAYFGNPSFFVFSSKIVDVIFALVGVAIAAIILAYAFRYKNIAAAVLAIVQVIATLVFDFFFASQYEVECCLYVDTLSIIMALIIGIIGSGICVYALGYMQDFQAHEPEGKKDERPKFFALMFLFLGAMYLIVLSNSMTWMLTGWEITTVCSFLLIGYTKTDEAISNAFRQIIMNLIGGIAFTLALYLSAFVLETLDFSEFIQLGCSYPELIAVPLAALALAGLTKAAQMPFHTWLLGAMVAPTPTSALLHSSTMVKAGVFLLVKLSPLFFVCPVPAAMVILVGGVTFMLCSFMAISQSNAKRVLAYSTIANLGLITACAGVGTPEAIWAAIFLIIFHAAAKSLLFICVGTAEHHIGSRDIEDMDLLFERMPRLAKFMMLGIMCMFIAPFGMLVSKWAALVSFVDTGHYILLILLAFGSAATFMFWGKWLGKLAGIAGKPEELESTVHRSEWISIGLMALIAIAACVMLPTLSNFVVEPYCVDAFEITVMSAGILTDYEAFFSDDTLWIISLLSIVLIIMLFAGVGRANKAKQATVYLAGVSVDNDARAYRNSLSATSVATARNWYMENIFGEKRLKRVGEVFCIVVIVAAFALACFLLAGIL